MSDDFQQTIDLREKMQRPKPASPAGRKAAPAKSVMTPLEKIYGGGEDAVKPRADLRTISQPNEAPSRQGLIKIAVFILAILLISVTVYYLFFRTKRPALDAKEQNWHAIKLLDGEIFYGQVFDVKADPIVIANVYYNYDQAKQNSEAKDKTKTVEETGNLRLVKRGKETHGPAGTMNIVRAQVLFMEPLKTDSKVLKAILDYEK